MTVNQAIAKISDDLDDLGFSFFQQADILTALQNAFNDISLSLYSNETTYNLELTPNIPYYDLVTEIPFYYAVAGAYNKSNSTHLQFKTPLQLAQIRNDYELWKGNPFYISVVDYRRVGFFPVPVSNFNILLQLKLSSDNLTASDNPIRIPDYAEDLLLNFAKVELLEMAEEIYKAADLQSAIVGDYKTAKGKAVGRAMPALPIAMRGVDVSLMRKVVESV